MSDAGVRNLEKTQMLIKYTAELEDRVKELEEKLNEAIDKYMLLAVKYSDLADTLHSK